MAGIKLVAIISDAASTGIIFLRFLTEQLNKPLNNIVVFFEKQMTLFKNWAS